MYVECHFNASTGEILAVWEAGNQPFSNPADAWKPFSIPLDPDTHETLTNPDGTPDAARLPPGYVIAKMDLDYATQLAIEQGAYDAREPCSTWIMTHFQVDLASVTDGPPQAGCVKTARLQTKA